MTSLRGKIAAFALLCGAAVLATFAGCSGRDVSPTAPAAKPTVVLIEAESVAALPAWMRLVAAPAAGGGSALAIPEEALKDVENPAGVSYAFTLDKTGYMSLWLRTRWDDGCGNSIDVALDSAEPFAVGNDGTYGAWHWVRGGRMRLDAGQHVLRLLPREDGLAVDQILLTSASDHYPSGVLGDAAAPPQGGDTDLPPDEPVGPPKPFLAAIGGCYRSGFESALIRLGISCERLADADFVKPEVLKKYDLICLSCPGGPEAAIASAFEAYVRQGGTLITEYTEPHDPFRPANDPDSLFVVARRQHRRRWRRYNISCVLHTDSSPIFGDHRDSDINIADDVQCTSVPQETNVPGAETYGTVTSGSSPLGAALLKRPYGKGTLYFGGLPFGFHSMWRGPLLDDILRRIILDAVGDRARPIYRDMPQGGSGTTPGVLFGDDFMVEATTARESWRILTGTFSFTGPWPPYRRQAFSLRARGPGLIEATGNPEWDDYRVAASVLPGAGRAGVWLTTTGGRRVGLVLDGSGHRLVLMQISDEGREVLAECPAPTYRGWRRLSLFARDGLWHGHLDGQLLITHAEDSPAATQGAFGLLADGEMILFDDFAVRKVSALQSGTDRAPGEEGSCFARAGITRDSIEARNLYSRQWYLPPAHEGDGSVRPALPTYQPATLFVDGKAVANVPALGEGMRIPLRRRPWADIFLRCPGWMDYTFTGRLTDWYCPDGRWQSTPRWSCDPDWEWLGTWTNRPSVLWHKAELSPPYCLNAYLAPLFETGTREQGRDLNLIVAGNGKVLVGGYTFRVMSAGQGCELWKGDVMLERVPGVGLPTGHAVHHVWFEVRAVVEPGRIRFFFEGRQVIDYTPEEPVSRGHVGIWTQNNGINVARATLSISTPPAGDTAAAPRVLP